MTKNKEWVVLTIAQGRVIDMQPAHAPDEKAVRALIADHVRAGRWPRAKHDVYDAQSFWAMVRFTAPSASVG